MLFNSLHFAVFFPIVTALYFLLPHRFRWQLLLLASCYFYMAFIPVYILILFFTITVDYFVGLGLEATHGQKRRWLLVSSLAANVGVLAVFKYWGFAQSNVNALAQMLGWNYSLTALEIILPIGLSFHTFQSMSYIIEVYRSNQRAERHLGIFALYVLFYPQLVAGPIERPQNLLSQFREKHYFEYRRVTDGLKLMMWGLFKKVVIADRLAVAVDAVYARPQAHDGIALTIVTVLFAYQIYCDFSGYSDIAIGAAQVMGFRLMENFRQPYFARSISEFWRRWHISLSTWFRDYLYVPLGGNRVARWRWYVNLTLVFVVSGLWHGANWTFVIWGALHGAYLVASIWTSGFRARMVRMIGLDRLPLLHRIVQSGTTLILVCLAWIFFRAATLQDAWYVITHLHTGWIERASELMSLAGAQGVLSALVISKYTLLAILVLETGHFLQTRGSVREMAIARPLWFRWGAYYALGLWVLLSFDTGARQFIYFQF
jgi:alginate O-acetyltransferase complex protein AlgI